MRLSKYTRVASVLLVMLAMLLPITAAAAPAFDDSGYSEEQKEAARESAKEAAATALCQQLGLIEALVRSCEDAVEIALTAEALADAGAGTLCSWISSVPLVGGACEAIIDVDLVKTAFTGAYAAALTAQAAPGIAFQFVKDAVTPFDNWLNDMYASGMDLLQQTVQDSVTATEFRADSSWWREAYGAAAGIGLLVLAVMLLLTLRQASEDQVSPEELGRSLTVYVPMYVILTVCGPPIAWVVSQFSNDLSRSIIAWGGPDLQEFVDNASIFAVDSASMTGGVGVGLIVAIVLLIAAFGLLITLTLATQALYIVGVVGAIAFAMLVNPRWRRKALAVPLTWLGILLARPALFLVLGVVTKLVNAQIEEASDNPASTARLVAILGIVLAVAMVAFTPYALLKFFPLLPDGGDSIGGVKGGTVSGAVAGAATSSAMRVAQSRAARMRDGSGNTGGGGGRGASPLAQPSTSRATPARGGGSAVAPAGGGSAGGGRHAAAGGRSGLGFGRRGAGSAKGAAGKGVAGAGAAGGGATRGAAASGAGGVARNAGAAVGGATTGGALFAAHMGLTAAQAGMNKIRQTTEAGIPEFREVRD